MKRILTFGFLARVALATAVSWSAVFSFSGAAFAAPGDSVTSFWKLGEASGTRADEFGGNTLSQTGTVGQAAGKVGNAASFPGNAFLYREDNASLSTGGDTNLSISAWVYMTAKPGTDQGIVTKWNSSGVNQREYALSYLTSSDRFVFIVSGNGTASTVLTDSVLGSPSLNTWYHIVGWHDAAANTLNLQINGGTIVSTAHSSGTFDSTARFYVGAYNDSNYFNGRIDAVGVWKRLLTAEERGELYNAGSGNEYSSVAAVPSAPIFVSAIGEDVSASLAWTAPASNGSAITDYVVEYKLSSEPTTWSTFADGTSASPVATVTGLTNGSSYDFRISATNGIGTGPVSSTATATPSVTTLESNAVSFWKMEEASGSRTDQYAGNTLAQTGTVGQAAGKLGNAGSFPGNAYLSVADNSGLSMANKRVTVSAWVYMTSKPGSSQGIAIKWNSSSANYREYGLYYNATFDRFAFVASGDGLSFTTGYANSLGSPSLNTWYHVVGWYDGVNINIQANGGTIDSTAHSAGIYDGPSSFYVGGFSGASYFNGRIDAVGVWNRVLTSAQRAALYNSGTGAELPPAASAPGIPSSLSAVAGDGQASLSWTAPSANGSAITDYVVEYKLSSEPTTWSVFADGTSASPSAVVTGLTNGLSYDFRVSATNGIGTGSSSATASATPTAVAIETNLVSFWKLNEASGNRLDGYGGNTLTQSGTVSSSSGKIGNAASFPASAFLYQEDSAGLSMGSDTDFTVSAWVYMTSKSTGASQGIAIKWQSVTGIDQREYGLFYDSVADRFKLALSSDNVNNAALAATTFGSPSLNTWYHVVGWHDAAANTVNIQVNGGAVDSASWTNGTQNGSGRFYIGGFSDSRYFSGLIDAVGVWKRTLSVGERAALYNAGAGAEYPVGNGNGISISSPRSYQVVQRDGSDVADMVITGTYTGSPTSIEASWNGGAYSTIVASPAGGAFSGTLTDQPAGQGTLTVRFTNDTGTYATQSYVGVGDIYVIAGQSNASGRGTNNQAYSHGSLKAILFGNDDQWKELADPTDSNSGQVDSVSSDASAAGSPWPLLATRILADQGVPVAFIPTALGGTTIYQWQKSSSSAITNLDATAYSSCSSSLNATGLYGSMNRRIVAAGGSVKGILFFQGETDALRSFSGTSYQGYLNCFVNNAYADYGVGTVVGMIGDYDSQADKTKIDAIRSAQTAVWNANAHAYSGPAMFDVNVSVADAGDGVHFKTNAEMQTLADRWWASVSKAFYGGTDARGPRISSVTHNAAKTQLTLSFTDESSPAVADAAIGTGVFTVKDNGTPVFLSSATRISASQVRVVLSSAAAGTVTVSMAAGSTGYAAAMPRDSSAYSLPAEPFIDQSSSLLDVPSAPAAPLAVAGAASVSLSWSAPAANGSAITDYVIEYKLASEPTTWTAFADGTSASTSATVTGLANGSAYDFRISAVNGAGASSASSTSSATPAGAPSAPAAPSASAGNASVGLTWTAPAANGSAITDYVIEYKLGTDVSWTTFADGTSASASATVTGLVNGSSYDFRVSAVNGVGTSSASSSASAVPAGVPSAPSGLLTVAGAASVSLSWTAPSANGSAITDYVVEYKLSSEPATWATFADGTSTSTSATVTGLTAGDTYDFRVSAVNAIGTSSASATASQLPSPAAISSVSQSSGVITWTTDTLSSSRVEYGPSSAYGLLTAVTDTAPRVLSHSVALPSLLDCVTYHYRAVSSTLGGQTTVGTDGSFTTPGCAGSASVVSSVSNTLSSGSGGSLSLLSSGRGLSLSVPAGFAASDADFQAKELSRTAFFASAGTPSGMTAALSSPFSLKAVVPSTGALQSSFLSALTVSFSYSDSEIAGLDESSLKIYRWDSPSWTQLSGCSVNAASNSVSCATLNFSDFALFGTPPAAAPSGSVAFLFPSAAASRPAPAASSPAPSSSPSYAGLPSWQGTTPSSVVSSVPVTSAFRFKKALFPWSSSPDVKELQKFLNARGFAVASRGAGSPGKETSYYGSATVAAVRRYQARHAEEILKPSGLKRPTGTFGPATMAHANGELGK